MNSLIRSQRFPHSVPPKNVRRVVVRPRRRRVCLWQRLRNWTKKWGQPPFFVVRKVLGPIAMLAVLCFSSFVHAQTVRVAVLQDIPKFSLSIEGSYQIFPMYSAELLAEGGSLHEVSVTGTPAGIQLGDQELPVFGITLRLHDHRQGLITLNGRHFRGGMDIYRQKDQTLLIINHLDIEDYLQGVLYHEVSHRWPIEVLKAQAVAARTYAIYQTTVSVSKDFDLTSDAFSQVYGGAASEKKRTNKAVADTRGEILIWDGKVFPPYFHATCGGHTLSSRELWSMDVPPLQGVRCPYCVDSPYFYWKVTITKEEAIQKFKKAGYPLKDIDAIEVSRTDPSGRALDLILVHPQGEMQLSANVFRLILGPNQIRSAFFTVEIQDRQIVFRGRGWGHGVVLCQWGAYGMARQGKKMEQILAHYYPGAQVVRLE